MILFISSFKKLHQRHIGYKFFLIVGLFLLFNSMIAGFYIKKSNLESHNKIANDQLASVDSTIKYLFIGDSHVHRSLDTRVIEDSFNFANGGENYLLNYLKLSYYLDNYESPEMVFMPIDPHSFSFFNNDVRSNVYYWLELTKDLSVKKDLVDNLGYKYYLYKFMPYLGAENIFLNNPFGINEETVYDGYRDTFTVLQKYDYLKLQERLDHHFPDGEFRIDENKKKYFLKILDLCKEKNIKIGLVRFPVTQEYLNEVNTIPKIEDYYKYLNEIKIIHPEISIFDFHDEVSDYSFFKDYDHLNSKGAKLISKELMALLSD